MNIKKMVLTGLLMAFAILIPLAMGIKIVIPPFFSATLASHVPVMLSMFLGPFSAIAVAAGSAVGFLITLGPIVGARAFMHVGVSLIGAYMIKKGFSFWPMMLILAPIHGALESLVVLPFGFDFYKAFVVVGIGTILHHLMDAGITRVILPVMRFASNDFSKTFKKAI